MSTKNYGSHAVGEDLFRAGEAVLLAARKRLAEASAPPEECLLQMSVSLGVQVIFAAAEAKALEQSGEDDLADAIADVFTGLGAGIAAVLANLPPPVAAAGSLFFTGGLQSTTETLSKIHRPEGGVQ